MNTLPSKENIPPESTQSGLPKDPSLTELLQKNNEYLEKLVQMKQKELHTGMIFQGINVFILALPWIITLIVGFFVWQNLTQYFQVLNGNLNILKSNYETLHGYVEKITPDFSGIVPKLKQTWQDLPWEEKSADIPKP